MKFFETRTLLGLGLTATLAAVYFAPALDQDSVVPIKRKLLAAPSGISVIATGKPSTVPTRLLAIHSRDQNNEEEASIFAPSQWTKPAPPVIAAPPPVAVVVAPPQAPPLPFQLLGRYIEHGESVIFLQHNERNLAVRVGDLIADQYKVESLQGSQLNLRYLPLNQLQTLDIGNLE